MGYKGLIQSYVDKTFNQYVQDLAEDVILSKKTVSDFNFTTGDVKKTNSTTTSVKAIITDIDKKGEVHNAVTKSLMLNVKEIDDITAYDSVSIGDDTWKIGPLIKSDGYVMIVEINKEA